MEERLNCEDSKIDQKHLNRILSIVEGYEVEVVIDRNCSYKCVWKSNSLEFYLRIIKDTENLSNTKSDFEMPIINVLLHCGDDELVLDQIKSFDNNYGTLVIFDEEEDIQMFSKDIWNLLVHLDSTR